MFVTFYQTPDVFTPLRAEHALDVLHGETWPDTIYSHFDQLLVKKLTVTFVYFLQLHLHNF